MSLDLNDVLRDWPFEPGNFKVRRILGTDGKEKIQVRIDLGVIQMETSGRPDGTRPHRSDTLLEWHQARARQAEKAEEDYALSPDDLEQLQIEAQQFNHRYVARLQLGDYAGVMRDTQHNLDLFEFVSVHAPEESAEAVEHQTPYLLTMHTRARASIEIEREEYAAAVRAIQRGIAKIRAFFEKLGNPEAADSFAELSSLQTWLEEVRSRQPVSKLERMRREMEKAIESEAYERAAELRDAMKAISTRKS